MEKAIDLAPLYPFPPLGPGECILSESAKDYGLKIGDQATISLNFFNLFSNLQQVYTTETGNPYAGTNAAVVYMPCTIKEFNGNGTNGKYPDGIKDGQVIMEHEYFLNYMIDYAPLVYTLDTEFIEWVKERNRVNDFINVMMMTLPKPRIDYYSSENYQVIQDDVTEYADEIIEFLGYYPVLGVYSLLS